MIGVKSIAALVLAAVLVGAGIFTGRLAPSHLAHLSPGACFAIGLLASLALGLVMAGWRPDVRSGAVRSDGTAKRELPAAAQRVLVLLGFASLALVAIDNHAAARIVDYPRSLAEPSPSTYCLPEPSEDVAAPAPPPPPEEQPGCALVRRAFELGYRKSLGDCAPKQQVTPVAVAGAPKREVCQRRQLDEPWLHYAARKVTGTFASASERGPIAVVEHRVEDVRTHVSFLDDRLADIKHSIVGTKHAAHHLWIELPDPHPGSLAEYFVGAPRCEERFEHLPLWPRWTDDDRSRAVEHVLGQLLFAARFGTTASCTDYELHWTTPGACSKLAAEPLAFLDGEGDALAGVRGVLDRRRRQIAVGKLAKALGRPESRPPPPVAAVVSLHCFAIDPAGTGVPTGKIVTIDGDAVSLREVRVPAVVPTGAGPIDIYRALAALFAGTFDRTRSNATAAPAGAAPGGDAASGSAVAPETEPVDDPQGAADLVARATVAIAPAVVDGEDFLLTRFDALADADPFRGARWPLERAELGDVFPYERHLRGFIDTFRRRYLSQRGRL